MDTTQDFDMTELYRLLKVSDEHKAFAHGQLKRAASKVIRDFGYDWATIPQGLSKEESRQLIYLKIQLKKTVFESTKGWHSNQSMVWRRFREYAKRVGARHETLKLIAKIRNQLSQ